MPIFHGVAGSNDPLPRAIKKSTLAGCFRFHRHAIACLRASSSEGEGFLDKINVVEFLPGEKLNLDGFITLIA